MAGALIAAPARPAHAATSLQAFVVQLADVRQIYGPGFRMVMS